MNHAGWIRLILLLGAVAALEAACRVGLVNREAVIPPSAMARGFPSASRPSPGICHLASRSLATRNIAFGSGVTRVASARM
jgi:hypothetical protein